MRKTIWYIVGGQLAAISIPALAQDTAADSAPPPPGAASEPMMTPGQMAIVDTWPAEKQAMFRQWPDEVRSYFWELPTARQDVFWRLNDNDKVAVAAMDEAGRAAAWDQIDAKLAGSAEIPPTADNDEYAEPADDAGEAEVEAPEVPEPMGRN